MGTQKPVALLIGPCQTGKTTILNLLKKPTDEIVTDTVTIGLFREVVPILDFFHVVSWTEALRRLLPIYVEERMYQNAKAIIWVHDCSNNDTLSLKAEKITFDRVLQRDDIRLLPFSFSQTNKTSQVPLGLMK